MSAALAAVFICTTPVVHDGDSLRCDDEKIRIANIDAPEMPGSPKCDRGRNGWCDYQLAEQSRAALAEFVMRGEVRVRRLGVDAYGRTLAQVTVNGQDAGQYLIALGLARRWK